MAGGRLARIDRIAGGEESGDTLRRRLRADHRVGSDSEGALEIIESIAGASNHYHLAVNLPNQRYITNLPEGAIVETPGLVSGFGVCGVGVGAVHGDRQAALQCLLLA